MTQDYSVDYFIKKFEAIPESKWTTGVFRDFFNNRCAMGHCMPSRIIAESTKDKYRNEDMSLKKTFTKKFKEELYECAALSALFNSGDKREGSGMVFLVNNGDDSRYQQPSPKQRILAALYDIKKMQEPQHTDITSSLAILPVDERSDLINKPKKELI